MRLARFRHDDDTDDHPGDDDTARLGLVLDEEIVDVSAAVQGADLVALLAAGTVGLEAVARMADGAERRPLVDVTLLAPVPQPPKFLAIGLNYADHLAEMGREAPAFPVFFNKQRTCVVGPGDAIHVPRVSDQVDYEGELGVVIGRRARHVPVEHALDVVAGYTVVNDVTVRDWQAKAPTMTIGKSFDTHGPVGPWIVTPDEVPDPQTLRLHTEVNGEVGQDTSTAEMIFDVATQIATLSTSFTLEPGDLVATGTPAGVGVARRPPRFLRPGDTVRIEIEGVGVLENPVITEPAGTAAW
ncbi:fumarylacetoacetate hydrolase family protein [soil metagenome]